MTAWPAAAIILAHLLTPCRAMEMTGRAGHGLIGYGIPMYEPICPSSCRSVLSSSPLNCSTVMIMPGGAPMTDTSPKCYAEDERFLTSLAWCIEQRCTTLRPWQIEKYWHMNEPGSMPGQPDPKWTYQAALSHIPLPPTAVLSDKAPLNVTSVVPDDRYQLHLRTLTSFAKAETTHSTYGLTLVLCGFIIPIAASLLRFLPLPKVFLSRWTAILIDAPLFPQAHQRRSLKWLGEMPTRGQAIFLAYIILLNIVLSAAGYEIVYPSSWWDQRSRVVVTYITNRFGVLSFANLPLVVLYAGRNNLLLTLTDWRPTTFIMLHTCVAALSTIQAILHSVIYLAIYVSDGTHASESQLPYWYWGIIATLGMSLLLPASLPALRRRWYEVFLASHIIVAALAFVGCYLHIYYRFAHQWGYEVWIWTAIAVWGFDRAARLLRLARYGVRWASITAIDEQYLRVDIPGLASEGHAYLYFPSLTWRVWENHPFSAMTVVQDPTHRRNSSPIGSSSSTHETSKAGPTSVILTSTSDTSSEKQQGPAAANPPLALSFFVQVRDGATKLLHPHRQLPVLIEAGYRPTHRISPYSTLVCIVGGVGITAVISLLRSHQGRAKLYWSSRSNRLVEAVEPMLKGIERDVLVGQRHQLRAVIQREAAEGVGELVVLVSSPPEMADEARVLSVEVAKTFDRPISFVEESFSW